MSHAAQVLRNIPDTTVQICWPHTWKEKLAAFRAGAEALEQYQELVDALCSPSWMGRNRHESVIALAKRLRDSQSKIRPMAGAGCALPPSGWICTRRKGHDGPCAAVPSYDDALRVAKDAERA